MHIPELNATIPIDKVAQIELAKGKDLPSQTIMMLGVVGVVVVKKIRIWRSKLSIALTACYSSLGI
jgi:hypothetical protein